MLRDDILQTGNREHSERENGKEGKEERRAVSKETLRQEIYFAHYEANC
jgi:hypothetical protein